MMPSFSNPPLARLLRLILMCATCFAATARAEDVSLTAIDGGLEISGEVVGFDGTVLRLMTEAGEVSLNYDTLVCTGAACPKPDAAPVLRLAGAPRLGGLALPALVEAYGASNGFVVKRHDPAPRHIEYELTQDGAAVLNLTFHLTNSAQGLQALLDRQTDVALSVREIKPSEARAFREAGLGVLDDARLGRIFALDAAVPVVPPTNPLTEISLNELRGIVSGEITDWSALGGDEAPITLHLGPEDAGLAQGLLQLLSQDEYYSATVFHQSAKDALEATIADRFGLSLAPMNATGNGKTLALREKCGLATPLNSTTVKAEDYPLTMPLFLYLADRKIAPAAQNFLDWTRTPRAQLIIRRAGLIDRSPVPIPIEQQGERLASAIRSARDGAGFDELERLVAFLAGKTRLSTTFRFEEGSTRLDAQSRSNLKTIAQALRDGHYRDRDLILVGFSDGLGEAAENRALSKRRAQGVLTTLERLMGGALPEGVSISVEAFGEALPMGCDDTEWGRKLNRRVEIWASEKTL